MARAIRVSVEALAYGKEYAARIVAERGCRFASISPAYAGLRARHNLVSERKELVMKGRTERCVTCGTTWPCEVGQALAIIDLVLVWP